MRPEAVRTPAFSTRAFLRRVVAALRSLLVHEAADEAAHEDREGRLEGQVHADREEHGLLTRTRMREIPIAMPTMTSGHAISPPTMPWRARP